MRDRDLPQTSPSHTSPQIEAICRGTPFEMGVAQGKALATKIALVRTLLPRLEAFRMQQPRWLPYSLFAWLAARHASRKLGGRLASSYPDYDQRLRGISAGSKVGLDLVRLVNALEPLLATVDRCTVIPPLGACSAVAVRGRRSATGEPMIVRNFDYLPLVQPIYALRRSEPAGGLASLDFIGAPLAGAVDGLNERGLAITYDYAFTVDSPTDPAPPISFAISLALAECATVADAAGLIAAQPRWGGGLLMLADASGDIASLELSSTRAELRRPAAGEDLIFHTNAYSTAQLCQVQVDERAVFDNRAPATLRGRQVLRSSNVRGARFAELLARHERLGLEELGRIMSDHGPNDAPSHESICVHSDYWFTTACLQMLPVGRTLRVAYSSACQAKFEEIRV
jgi:hypothetical protein